MANTNEQIAGKSFKVIIAVNTPHGVGYFTDCEGCFLFRKQFEGVSQFTEGLASVKQNGKYGYINTKGELVAPCIYDGAKDFSEGLARVEKNGKYGFINTKGELVISCIYDNMPSLFLGRFFEGLANVMQNGKWNIINNNGKVIVAECNEFTFWSRVEMEKPPHSPKSQKQSVR